MNKHRHSLDWILKHRKEPLGKKELEHHENLKLILDNGYKPVEELNDKKYLERFAKGDNWVVYDHSLNRVWVAYINGSMHHSAHIIKEEIQK